MKKLIFALSVICLSFAPIQSATEKNFGDTITSSGSSEVLYRFMNPKVNQVNQPITLLIEADEDNTGYIIVSDDQNTVPDTYWRIEAGKRHIVETRTTTYTSGGVTRTVVYLRVQPSATGQSFVVTGIH